MSTPGGSQRTDNPFDVMIEGDAFFVVNNGSGNYFTRAGAFTVDARGTLCTPTGATVMGWQPDPENPSKCLVTDVSALQVMSPANMSSPPEATTDVTLTGNIDYNDTQLTSAAGRVVNVNFYDNLGHLYTAGLKFQQVGAATGSDEAVTNQYRITVTDIKDETGQSLFVRKNVDEEGNVTYSTNEAYAGQFSFGVGDGLNTLEIGDVNEQTGEFTIEQEGVLLNFNASTGRFVSVGEDAEAGSTKMTLASAVTPNPTINFTFCINTDSRQISHCFSGTSTSFQISFGRFNRSSTTTLIHSQRRKINIYIGKRIRGYSTGKCHLCTSSFRIFR